MWRNTCSFFRISLPINPIQNSSAHIYYKFKSVWATYNLGRVLFLWIVTHRGISVCIFRAVFGFFSFAIVIYKPLKLLTEFHKSQSIDWSSCRSIGVALDLYNVWSHVIGSSLCRVNQARAITYRRVHSGLLGLRQCSLAFFFGKAHLLELLQDRLSFARHRRHLAFHYDLPRPCLVKMRPEPRVFAPRSLLATLLSNSRRCWYDCCLLLNS